VSDSGKTQSATVYKAIGGETVLVTRSKVPEVREYGEYKPYLRRDFFHSCAYCTMTEAEAQSVRFTIDHYEPQNARPDLVKEYSNLMWSCDMCNTRKGDRTPPPNARTNGVRYFRPDFDRHKDHYESNGERLRERTSIGYFTIEALDLNRLALRRIRGLRGRLMACDRYVVAGIAALREIRVDQLPKSIAKAKVVANIQKADKVAERLADEIDELLRDFAKSPLIDDDLEADARNQESAKKLRELEVLYPGAWRAPRKSKQAASK
jgi:5-methylcytosine-specific restriction endonuclease McrA